MGFSGVLGVGLAIGGGVLTALAGLQFRAFLHELKSEELPRSKSTQALALLLAFSVSAIGVLLGIYLLR
jgi:hypothetical protein